MISALAGILGQQGDAGGLLASDTFTRADGAIGVAETGQTYTTVTTCTIVSNTARVAGPNGFALIDCLTADVTISTDITPALNGSEIGVGFRHTDASNWWRAVRTGTTTAVVQKRVAGTTTTVASLTGLSLPTSTARTWTVVLSGSSIELKIDGSSVWTGTDSAHSTVTRHGLAIGAASNNNWDNLTITAP